MSGTMNSSGGRGPHSVRPQQEYSCPLVATVQRETFHHPCNNPLLGGRVRAQTLFETAEKAEQLAHHYVDDACVFITHFTETRAFESDVGVSDKVLRNIFADDQL